MLDPTVLPAHPFYPHATQVSADVPVIIGNNRTEMTLFADPAAFSLDESWNENPRKRYARRACRRSDPGLPARQSAGHAVRSVLPDLDRRSHHHLQQQHCRAESGPGKAPTYRYRFDWETPALGGRLKSPHTLEMPFVFDNVQVAPGLTGGASPEAVALAARVSEAWIAFATRGDPNSKKSGLPPWPPYDSARRATMLFNNESKVVNDPGGEQPRGDRTNRQRSVGARNQFAMD